MDGITNNGMMISVPMAKDMNPKPEEVFMLKIGDTVSYHSIIGGEVTSSGHLVKDVEREPNNYGCDVAWITGKSGCVAMAALSKEENKEPV